MFLHVGVFYQAISTLFWFQNGPKHAVEHPGQGHLRENTFSALFRPLLISKWGISRGDFWKNPINCGHFQTHFEPILGLYRDVLVLFSGRFRGKQHHLREKNRQSMTKRQLAQVDSAPRYGHQTPVVHVLGPFGAVLGPNDMVDRVKTGITRVKGTPHVV